MHPSHRRGGHLITITAERDTTAASGRVDPITLEVVRHSLVAMVDEAEANLTRTAFSTIIREYKDYCVGMVTARGETIAQSRGSIPTFVADLGTPVLDGIAMWGNDINEGDYLINNYAGVCGQHLNNVVMYTPIFNNGSVIAFAALRTHWPDIGGGDRGVALTTEVFQEGIQFRNAKIYKRDVLDPDLNNIILYNTRQSEATFGDLEAQIAGCRLVKRRFEDLVARYGWETVETAIHVCWDQSEAYVRQQIRDIPNGRYFAESFIDSDGLSDEQIPIRVTVIVDDEDVTIDFSDMPPQVEGPFNSGATGGAASAAKVAFKGAISPFLLANEGEFRPCRVVTRPGTLVSATPDAAYQWWSTPIKTVIDVILLAFSQAIPDRVPAGNNAQYGNGSVRGRDPKTGRTWSGGGMAPGGWGAFLGGDGQSAMLTTTHGDTRRVPIEVGEAENGGLITAWELVTDSGGAGKWRGGLGTRLEALAITDGVATIRHDRAKVPPWGLFGGHAGKPSRGEIRKPGEAPIEGTNLRGVRVPAGTRVTSINNGGGGYGSPLERDLAAIDWDVRQGYVSRSGAEAEYGVVFDADGAIDVAATERLRAERRTSGDGRES